MPVLHLPGGPAQGFVLAPEAASEVHDLSQRLNNRERRIETRVLGASGIPQPLVIWAEHIGWWWIDYQA